MQATPGSGPVDLNEESDINTNPPIVSPTSQRFEEVSKTYPKTRLEQKGKALEDKQRSKRPEELQQGGTIIAEQTKSLLDKRQKRIKLSDLS